jgi:hypothetical protein
MGLMDKVKAGAGQAKEMAEQAFDKAKDEAKELQLKRELGSVHEELGKTVVDLVDQGEVSHANLESGVARARELKAEIEAPDAPKPS